MGALFVTISPEYRPRLVVMVKEPRAGRVKTRLGREIGMTRAAWWFRHHSARLIRRIQDPRWQTILAVAPDTRIASPVWPAHLPRITQGPGDVGARMARLFRALPPGPAAIIGGDIPAIEKVHISACFAKLGSHDTVFGPASDGGFWLVGLKRRRPAPTCMFKGVRWSTHHALADTLATIPGHTHSLIATLDDVDTASDLARLAR